MKFGYFNPTVVAIDEVPVNALDMFRIMVEHAHKMTQFNDAGNQAISIRGGQQIQLIPNEIGLDIAPLTAYIETRCQEYVDAVMKQNNRDDLKGFRPKVVSAWTIRQTAGDYQALHAHEAHISGNMYIDAPMLNEGSNRSDANLEFRLPVIRNPARFVFVDQIRLAPTVGTMVVFPSYLPHTVYPWKGHGTRTVLAWDAMLVPDDALV